MFGRNRYESVDWFSLTRQPGKEALFRREAEFWEALADIRDALGIEAESILPRITILVLQPAAIKKGSLNTVLAFAAENGFTPIACRSFLMNRNISHALWRYQWNLATVDRIRLATFMNVQAMSTLIVVRDDRPEGCLPAAVRLWGLKGRFPTSLRQPHHLRTRLGMKSSKLGFVHTSDEPADLVRELGIIFDPKTRIELLQLIRANFRSKELAEVETCARNFTKQGVRHSVELNEVI